MKKITKRRTTVRHPERNRKRFGIILISLTGLLLVTFVGRFAYVAVGGTVDRNDLKAYRTAQYTRGTVLKAKRGTILDANGGMIAEDASTYTLYAVVNKNYKAGKKKLYVTDKDKTATALAGILPLAKDQILKMLTPTNATAWQVEFGKAGSGLSLATKKQIEATGLSGLYFYENPSRLYPNGSFASHTVGLAQTKDKTPDMLTGVMGLEQQFNPLLKGTNGYQSALYDNYGYQLPQSEVKVKKAKNGGTVTTTLDPNVQTYLETLMSQVQTQYAPEAVRAVVMDAKTGAILAASTRPTFDASTGDGLADMWRNTLVEDAYEPGSVMKIFTLASAIESGTYNPNTYYKSGHVTIGGKVIRDWNETGWGTIPLNQAFPRSSNTGFVKIAQDMGKGNQSKYLKAFGFGKPTGITLPSENPGSYAMQNAVDRANISFGQGISVNTMQLLQAMTAITNRGTEVQPRIVSKTVAANGKVTNYPTKVVGHPISATTAKQVLAAMQEVVNDSYGTGTLYKLPGIEVAAKTGTAQVAKADGSGYQTGDNNALHSLMAVAPADDPKYVVYISLYHAAKQTTSQTAMIGEIFKPLMTRLMTLAGGTNASIADKDTTKTVPAVANAPLTQATTTLTNADFVVSTVGTGNRVVQQLPASSSQLLAGGRVILLTNGAMTMPDVGGWSKADVLKLAQLTGKPFKFTGDGYATEQSLPVGALLTDQPVTVKFAGPD